MTTLRELRDEVRHYGVRSTLYDVWIRGLNRLFFYRVLRGITVASPHPDYLGIDPRYEHGFVARERLEAVAVRPEYELSPEFLRGAFAKGDRCYGILGRGPAGEDVLASYGWYSRCPTELYKGLDVHFGDGWVYMYKGYTHRDFRGQRLHAIGMTLALARLREEGARGIVSVVESNNFGSLKSVYRMGYADVGRIRVSRRFGRWRVSPDVGCRGHGLDLRPAGATT